MVASDRRETDAARCPATTMPHAVVHLRIARLFPLLWLPLWLLLCATRTDAQELRAVPITGQSLGGFVIPVEPVTGDIRIEGVRAWTWTVDDTQRVQLEGDVQVRFGGYFFTSTDAVVWINRIPSAAGLINQIAIYFPEAEEPTRRAGLGASGSDLLVTGSSRGEVQLSAVMVEQKPPPSGSVLTAATARVKRYLESVARGALLQRRPQVDAPPPPPRDPPLMIGASPVPPPPEPALPSPLIRAAKDSAEIFSPRGSVSFSAGDVSVDTAQNCVMLAGTVRVDYTSPPGEGPLRELQLSADRGVVFLKPESTGGAAETSALLDARDIAGIYLEGDVIATDSNYVLRGKRVYYDLERNKAIVLDAVMRTTMRNGLLAYARAAEMRQIAAGEFEADTARVSTSEFFTPHLSVGVSKLTVTEDSSPGGSGSFFTGQHATLRASGVPLLYWPYIAGSPNQIPLKYINVGFNDFLGTIIKSDWDLLDLMGIENAEPLTEVRLLQEAYTKNAAGLGVSAQANIFGSAANIRAMGLYDFGNEEQTAAGQTIISPIKYRGDAEGSWRGNLASDVTLAIEFAVFSDSTYASIFKQNDYLNRREYETMGYLNWQDGNNSLSLLLKYNPNNFISNASILASRPYITDKLPELAYQRYGDSLFGDTLTWSQQYSGNLMRLDLQTGSPSQLGISPLAFSTSGLYPSTLNVKDAYESAGYDGLTRSRIYTRQELSMPLELGSVKAVPFVHGQLAAYILNNFTDYNPDASDWRTLVGAGSRFSTEWTANYNSVRSSFLDLNRLHHVVQPSATLWYGWNSQSVLNMPVYDQEVEATSGAAVAHAAISNKLQTMRGGPGNWRSVDWLVLNVGAAVDNQGNTLQPTTTATDPLGLQYSQSPMPTFYSWRPEYSQWGDHVYANATWQLSDAFSLYGQGTYLLEDRGNSLNSFGLTDLGRGTIGGSVQQSPDVRVFAEYRYVNTFGVAGYPADEFLQGGFAYQLSKKYALTVAPQYDLVQEDFRAFSAALTRTFPDFFLSIGASYNKITDLTTFNASIQIPGAGRAGLALDSESLAQGNSLVPGLAEP
ncbi:MAG: hypothetical protein ACKO4V_03385 [Planctomycetota bacterium]